MEHEEETRQFREHLLYRLRTAFSQTPVGRPNTVAVFVDHERVGSLEPGGDRGSLQFKSAASIHTVEIRADDGQIFGGLYAAEDRSMTQRIEVPGAAIVLEVHNGCRGSSLSASVAQHKTWPQRLSAHLSKTAALVALAEFRPGLGLLVATQALLAICIVGLIIDRVLSPLPPQVVSHSIETMVPSKTMAPAQIQTFEAKLAKLAEMQTKTAETAFSQRNELSRLQQVVTDIAKHHQSLSNNLQTVGTKLEKQESPLTKTVDRLVRHLRTREQETREDLEAEIHSLVIANDRLNQERTDLEQLTGELKRRLKAAGIDVSKRAVEPLTSEEPAIRRGESLSAIQSAETPQPVSPFVFWVNFKEGIPEERIEQWMQEIHGRSGKSRDGWQAVEILDTSDSQDRIFNRIQAAPIVAAVRTAP